MTLPDNVGYSRVKGRLIRAVVDGSDSDKHPDAVPVAGAKVVFTPSVYKVVNSSEPEPVIIIMDPIIAATDDDGYLVSPDGEKILYLVASDDPDLNPTNFTYKVTITAPGLAAQTWNIIAPEGALQDLALTAPVPPSPGTELPAWEIAVKIVWEARDASVEEIQSLKESSMVTIENAREETINNVNSAEATAINSIETTKNNSVSEINNISIDVVNQVNTASSTGLTNIQTEAEQSLLDIQTNKNISLTTIEDTRDSAVETIESRLEVGELLVIQKGSISESIDLSNENKNLIVHGTLTEDVIVLLPEAPLPGNTITLELSQDSYGGKSVSIPGAYTSYGVSINPDPTPETLSELMLFWDGIRWHARISGLTELSPEGW